MQPFLRLTNASFSGCRLPIGRLCGWLLAGLLLGPQLPARPVLVKDINRKSTVAPEDFTNVNGTLFFIPVPAASCGAATARKPAPCD
ncbi:MAG: hypothetical protein ICV83_33580 [Cytophagales bacterium]|nr:hypothetical protein [Cytophagales bacterium]